MAKIGNLEVNTINIAESAVTGRAFFTGAGAKVVPNPGQMPIELYFEFTSFYSSPVSNPSGFTFTATVSGDASWSRSWTRTGNTGGSNVTNSYFPAILDPNTSTSRTYNISLTATDNGGGGGLAFGSLSGTLTAVYAKK